jgi:ketosteroid isomerase-like protein
LFGLLSPDVEWIATAPSDTFPHAGRSIGIEAAQSRIVSLAGQYKSRRFLPRLFVEEADRIAVYLDVELIHLESGTPLAFDVAHFWTFQGDKVVQYLELFNSGLAERQLRNGELTVPG